MRIMTRQSHLFTDRRLMVFGLGGAALLTGCGTRPPGRGAAAPAQPSVRGASSLAIDAGSREAAVAQAMLVVNTPYRYGGNTPAGGFDCSGLVQYVFNAIGATRLPRTTAQWAAASTPVAEGGRQRGDLVFFNTSGSPWSHMGIYVGQGQFVHAPSTGGTVRKDSLSNRYFAPRYLGARSVFAA